MTLTLDEQIKLMDVLEDFVLINIKYPFGDQTERYKHLNTVMVDLPTHSQEDENDLTRTKRLPLKFCYEFTEQDKHYIYANHAQGKYKETKEQKIYRETIIQKKLLSNDPNDTIEIPEIDRLPRYYDDILTSIKTFYNYIQSSAPDAAQSEKLRKKAFHIYSLHHDSHDLHKIPELIHKYFEKNHNGYQRKLTLKIIEKAFLQYAEEILLNEEKTNKITSTSIDYIIQQLEIESIPHVKNEICKQLQSDITALVIKIAHLKSLKNVVLRSSKKSTSEPQSTSDLRESFRVSQRKYKKLISSYKNKILEIEGKKSTGKKERKYTGNSKYWLKQHKVQDQSLFDIINKLVKKNIS